MSVVKKVKGLIRKGTHIDAIKASEFHRGGRHIIGFPFDGTACFRKGTKLGPKAFREVSDGIESYSPYLNRDVADKRPFDLGDIPTFNTIKNVDKQFLKMTDFYRKMVSGLDLKKDDIKLFTIGGEHSIPFAPIEKYLESYPDLYIIHLDAHADLRDGYEGHHYSHASIIRRVLDIMGVGHSLIQYGIRSGTKEEYDYMRTNKTIITSREEFIRNVSAIPESRPIYLTLDIDFFDPAFVPGTGTPEPGGEDFHCLITLAKILEKKNFVGADLVELSPPLDITGNSNVFASKVFRELLLAMN